MFNQMLDTYTKAAESALQWQTSLVHQGMDRVVDLTAWPKKGADSAMVGDVRAFQKKLAESVIEILRKHETVMRSQSEAGLKTMEESIRLCEASDTAEFLRMAEGLRNHSAEAFQAAGKDLVEDMQFAFQKMFDLMAKGVPVTKA